MSDDVQLYSAERKDGQERLIISMREFKGRHYVDLRVYFRTDSGNYIPTKTGVTVGLSEVFDVSDALVKACELAKGIRR